jgi:hypothetical protein
MKKVTLLIHFIIFPVLLWSTPAVPYSGKIDINGLNYFGDSNFTFSIYDEEGITHWKNGTKDKDSIKVTIFNGRYTVLLGGQGMNPLPSKVFLRHEKLYIKVHFDNGDGNGMRHLSPDQQITATPLALAAEYARIAESVAPGSITRDMLSADVLADLNRTLTVPSSEPSTSSFEVTPGSITHELLSPAVLADLNSSISQITREMLPPSVLADLNKSINRSELPPSVLADLNRSITRNMLPASVLADLNKSISRSDLPTSVLADLNRTITKNNLGSDVLSDLNSSISLSRLSPEVLAALQVSPSISTQPFARYDWRTNSATIEVRGRGHNLSYQWLKNGQGIAGANAPVLELSNPVLDDNATYSIQLTNSVGQTTSQNITLQQAIGAPGLPLEEANSTQIPRNGLVLWLDANDLNADGLADNLPAGTLIDSWKSKVGDANATQSSELLKPKSNFFGDTNLKAVAFDGGDYLLDDNASLPVQHIFFVFRGLDLKDKTLISDNNSSQINVGRNANTNQFHLGVFHSGSGGSVRLNGQVKTKFTSWEKNVASFTGAANASFNGNFLKLGIGARTPTSGLWEGELGEILFYDRALSNAERDAVERYLAVKWSILLPADQQAAEQAAYEAAVPPAEPENGLQAYYKFEPLAVEYDKLWDYSGNDRHLTMSGFDGDPWVDGVDGKGLSFDGANSKATIGSNSGIDPGTVSFWAKPAEPLDASDNPNIVSLFRYNNSIYQYFGFNKVIEGQGRHFALWQSNKATAVKVGAINQTPSGWLQVAITYDENSSTYEFFLNGQPLETVHYNTGLPRFGTGLGFIIGNIGAPYYRGLLDEFRIYNRSLTPAEVEGLYLQVNNPILRMAPEHNATVGANFSLSLAADNGPTTYLAEGLPAGLSLNVSTGQISGTVTQPGYHRVFVKAMNEHGMGSDVIAIVARPQTDQYGWPVDVPNGSDIPQNGLVLWLDANDVDADGEFDSGKDHLKLVNWADKAGKDHNATQATAANQPEIRSGQISGKPNLNVLVFEGNQSLGFERIKQIRTFFWAAGRSSGNIDSAIFYDAETDWISMGYGTTLWRTGSTSTIITDGQNRLNGSTFSGNGTFPTDLGIISSVTTDFAKAHGLGKRPANNSFFHGRIGEILIYDRVLSTTEIETVEKYLGSKWGIALEGEGAPTDITTGLMAHIPFDENFGNIASDVSGNNRHATLVNFDTNDSWIQGKIVGALELDGTNDWISVPVSLGVNYTFSLWLKTQDDRTAYNNRYDFSVGIFVGPNGTYGLSLNGGKLLYSYATGSNLSSSLIDHGNWVHLCGTRSKNVPNNGNSGYFELFINGTKESGEQKNENPNFGSSAYIGRVFDGPSPSNTPKFLTGTVDDLRVYNRTLSGTEIKALYDLGSKPLASTTYDNVYPRLTLTPVNNSVTTAHLTDQILKYLKPEITIQPQTASVPASGSTTLSASAEGKYLNYQWQKDGIDIGGETNATLVVSDYNGTQHDGNYTITISNDFGSVISAPAEVKEQ